MKGSTQSDDVPAGRLFLAGALGGSAAIAVSLALFVYTPFDGVVLLLGAAPLLLALVWSVRSALRTSRGSTAGGGSDLRRPPSTGPNESMSDRLRWLVGIAGGTLGLFATFVLLGLAFDKWALAAVIVVLEAMSLAVLVALARSGRFGRE